jgi:16S rRNA G966 N2-methylase RsmD
MILQKNWKDLSTQMKYFVNNSTEEEELLQSKRDKMLILDFHTQKFMKLDPDHQERDTPHLCQCQLVEQELLLQQLHTLIVVDHHQEDHMLEMDLLLDQHTPSQYEYNESKVIKTRIYKLTHITNNCHINVDIFLMNEVSLN